MQPIYSSLRQCLFSILVFLAFWGAKAVASEPSTNSIPSNIFLTDNGTLFWYKHTGEKVVHIKDIEAAKNSLESQPASQDQEGHWGLATNGFQLSLRFEKETFTNGEPITAIILMRNITEQTQTYHRPPQILAFKDGKQLEKKRDGNEIEVETITRLPQETLFPQTQHKDRQTLNGIYDLTQSGEYVFQAVCHRPEVASQKVSILIKN